LKREFNLNIVSSKKGPGSIETGIKFLQELEAIVIDRTKAPNTFREFSNAEFKIDRYGSVIPQLMPINDHSIDAVRYSLESEMTNIGGWNSKVSLPKNKFSRGLYD
jgi:phage terminase large subunit